MHTAQNHFRYGSSDRQSSDRQQDLSVPLTFAQRYNTIVQNAPAGLVANFEIKPMSEDTQQGTTQPADNFGHAVITPPKAPTQQE